MALFAIACSSPGTPMPTGSATTAPSTEPATPAVPPDTPAGDQLEWLIGALVQLSISDADLRGHFNKGYLATASPAALNQWLEGLNEWLQAPAGVKLISIKVDVPSMVVAIASDGGTGPRARIGLTVDSQGLIGDLSISPAITGPVPDTWADVGAAFGSVGPQVRLLVANLSNGSCQPVHSIDPNTAAPFGSVLKLYVLYALGEAVAAGKVSWDQPLTVTAKLKSVPSGVLQNEPDGTPDNGARRGHEDDHYQ
jgi:hypothetical protein